MSHPQEFVISVTNTVLYADATNYVFHGSVEGWESNLLFACSEYGCRTNICMDTLFNASWMGAFRDQNRNGAFDSEIDILRMNNVSGTEAVKTVKFAFGDVDGDGVDDLQERTDGTDPYSRLSVRISRKIKIENKDPTSGITNYYFIGASPDLTSANWKWSMGNTVKPEGMVSDRATDGCLYAVVYRDFNCNGVFDEGLDAISTNKIVRGSGTLTFTIGDADGDGVEDGCEVADRMNPLDGKSYCYQATLNVTGIFETTNALSYQVTFGDSVVIPATIAATNALVLSMGHHSTTNRESLTAWFWDDRNGDGVRDEDEACSSISVGHSGHSVNMTTSLPYGGFDADRNGLLDWWEVTTGLSEVDGAHGDTDDNDHDGLINLHEYWADTDPLTPDGSNTLLSVCARSVDDRLDCVDAEFSKQRFVDYHSKGSNLLFEANAQFWAADVNLGCASMWNDALHSVWGESCENWHMAGTAISKRHIICAHHYAIPNNTTIYFMGPVSGLVSRRIVGGTSVDGDIRINVLDADLPGDIIPAKVLPTNYSEYIADGLGLPVATLDQEEKLLVAELLHIPLSTDRATCLSARMPRSDCRKSFYENVIGGDSGNPRFLFVGSEVVLLNTMWKGGAGAGCYITHYINEIQRAMNILATGYSLDVIDLSRFQKIRAERGEK